MQRAMRSVVCSKDEDQAVAHSPQCHHESYAPYKDEGSGDISSPDRQAVREVRTHPRVIIQPMGILPRAAEAGAAKRASV